ncbi:TolC family protein [Pedobacter panaciterrae]|jgi:Outer membrane protein|uniref:TolC family protein n=1 Tax=Pedobacter panaciterrae TaxID=363849 RepID=UPI00155D9A78|nr:TolC family protein [Pedobacter panaciterrae]NQX52442.1 TolC family protein [Pedobacter panaciterrae]
MKIHKLLVMLLIGLPALLPEKLAAQTVNNDKQLSNATLQEVIDYALNNRPGVKQSQIDEEIGERDIKSALSGWFPQISGNANYNNNLKQQVNALTTNGETNYITFGTKHTSALTLQADQQFLNAGLIQASKASKYYRQQYKQSTENTKINTVVDVSKAYFDILTSGEQLNIINENIARLEKQLKDASAQYEQGLVDKTDFQRAQISLSNSKADKKRTEELLKYKYAYLKEIIGYGTDKDFSLNLKSDSMEQGILIDTNAQQAYENRVEYRLLQTQKQLQHLNTSYNKWSYLPSISGFINYSYNYLNNDFSNLYDKSFPSSVFGLKLSIPIFQGTKRIQEIRKSELQEKRIDLDLLNTKNQINTQYEQAMATYKANLNDWKTARSNVDISRQVYNTIKLQYDEGIKTYLDLMTSETDLRTAQLNYLNSLYSLLSSKLDVQQALGTIIAN